jgi:hypothetical protein
VALVARKLGLCWGVLIFLLWIWQVEAIRGWNKDL